MIYGKIKNSEIVKIFYAFITYKICFLNKKLGFL